MIIGYDARPIVYRWTGMRTYTVNLVRQLKRIAPWHNYDLYFHGGQPDETAFSEPMSWRRASAPLGWWWTFFSVPAALRCDQADLFHADYIVPPLASCRTVVTIHDATSMMFLEPAPFKVRMITNILTFIAAHRSPFVITASESAGEDIVRLFRVPARKIVVTPYGVDPAFQPIPKEQARRMVRERYGIVGRFILTVNFFRPRKNMHRLIPAFTRLKRDGAAVDTLVLTGGATAAAREWLMRMVPADLADNVIFTGYVPDDDLPLLYSAASVFTFPSLYEGFGLPPLEAMACGTPVVCADASSLPEVVGDAGLLVSPRSVEALTDALRCVLEDASLSDRLIQRGLVRAREFTWERTAEQTLAVYNRVMDAP